MVAVAVAGERGAVAVAGVVAVADAVAAFIGSRIQTGAVAVAEVGGVAVRLLFS